MSVRSITKVLDLSQHAGTELLTLVVLADYSDDDGNSYPSVASMARKCRMKPRNMNYILHALQASGELKVLKNEGPRGTNRYRIMFANMVGNPLQRIAPLQSSAPLQCSAPTPAMQCAKPLHPIADEPSLNRQEPKKTRARHSPHDASAVVLLPEVDTQVLKDWEAVRKAKRVGVLTATVAKSLRSEAAKAGLPIQQAIEICCARGWAGFNASWDRGDGVGAARARSGAQGGEDVFAGAI